MIKQNEYAQYLCLLTHHLEKWSFRTVNIGSPAKPCVCKKEEYGSITFYVGENIFLTGTTASRINNIYIANNIIPATDKGSIYIEYADSITLINNILQQRNEAEIPNLQTFQGIYLSKVDKITVLQNSIKAVKGLYGIYLSNVVDDDEITSNPFPTEIPSINTEL